MEPASDQSADPNADELRKIAGEIEAYLSKWVIRSRRVVELGYGATTSEVAMSSQVKKFEEQQRKWEVRRQRELDDLSDKAQELADAWLKLESEQRQFLQIKDAWQHRNAQPGPPAEIKPPSPTVDPPTHKLSPHESAVVPEVSAAPRPSPQHHPQYVPQIAPRMPDTVYANGRPACGNGREDAIRQFQQLRREVGVKHNR